MNIFISGGGRVGFHLARLLSNESHDVTVIEMDSNQIEQLDYALDVSTVQGDARDVLLLQSSGIGAADLFLAVTGEDETNLITATTAHGLGVKQVVARIHDAVFTQSDILYETILGLDYLLSPQALTAHEIASYVENPGMVATESFGRGLVQMQQIRVAKSPIGPEESLKDMRLPPGVLLGLISRNGSVEIPHGGSGLEEQDVVTLIGKKEAMRKAQTLFQGVEVTHDKIVIMGGSSIGLHLAQVLEKHGKSVKLFEWNMERCTELATILKKTKVVCRDATSRLALEQEHVDGADIFVATTHDDERNIMASVLAKEVGAKETIAVVHNPDFASVVGKLGIDHAVTPRAAFANRVLRLVNQDRASSLAVLEEGKADIIEYKLTESCTLLGRPLSEIQFPRNSLVASILRGEKVIVPRGQDELQSGDTVVIIAASEAVEAVEKLVAH